MRRTMMIGAAAAAIWLVGVNGIAKGQQSDAQTDASSFRGRENEKPEQPILKCLPSGSDFERARGVVDQVREGVLVNQLERCALIYRKRREDDPAGGWNRGLASRDSVRPIRSVRQHYGFFGGKERR